MFWHNFCKSFLHSVLILWGALESSDLFVEGNPPKGVNDEKKGPQTPQNYKEALFVYPPGIRSERDVPICSKWMGVAPTASTIGPFEGQGDMPADSRPFDPNSDSRGRTPSSSYFQSDGTSKRVPIQSSKSSGTDPGPRWASACNIVHKRFFYPPMIERLCRCPDRTECPWEWSQPPPYPNSPLNPSSSPGSKGSRDPYTIMLSSRSQAKFCTEVSISLPRCEKKPGHHGHKTDIANLEKTIRRTSTGKEIHAVKSSCYCPPLYRQWTFSGQSEPRNFGNGTLETSFEYQCNRLPRCKSGERCGNIRTDLHFSFYHCSCPRKHLCLPKVYPVESVEDVEEDVDEILFRGQVAPAYCTPFP